MLGGACGLAVQYTPYELSQEAGSLGAHGLDTLVVGTHSGLAFGRVDGAKGTVLPQRYTVGVGCGEWGVGSGVQEVG